MDLSGSECSSGCESGWTVYLDRLTNSASDTYLMPGGTVGEVGDDLSMVSDASSRPPESSTKYYYGSAKDGKRNDDDDSSRKGKNKDSCLNDTATSPVLHRFEARSLSIDRNLADLSIKTSTDLRWVLQGNAGAPPLPHRSRGYEFSDENLTGFSKGETASKKHTSLFKSSTKGGKSGQ
ncbi:hypothetical protein M569_15670 [Genlisea aurea]|uniref:Uncharacterized protein n=1 Tax=Genlisea aurea TaxID=192259 RepID=S8BWZ3_9LAMI|nr:hypothetical protein M569_15670 [Genlisea aurea]